MAADQSCRVYKDRRSVCVLSVLCAFRESSAPSQKVCCYRAKLAVGVKWAVGDMVSISIMTSKGKGTPFPLKDKDEFVYVILCRWAGQVMFVGHLNEIRQKGEEMRELGIRSVPVMQSDQEELEEFLLPRWQRGSVQLLWGRTSILGFDLLVLSG